MQMRIQPQIEQLNAEEVASVEIKPDANATATATDRRRYYEGGDNEK